MPLSKLELAVMSASAIAPVSIPSGAMHCAVRQRREKKDNTLNQGVKRPSLLYSSYSSSWAAAAGIYACIADHKRANIASRQMNLGGSGREREREGGRSAVFIHARAWGIARLDLIVS